jgi:hypothetical protein
MPIGRTLLDLLPGLMVFVLLTIDPPPPDVAPWILRAYSPLLLWALIRKIDEDSRFLGVRWRHRPWKAPNRPRDIAMQTALLTMACVFAYGPAS